MGVTRTMVYTREWSAMAMGYCADGTVGDSLDNSTATHDMSEGDALFNYADKKYMFGDVMEGSCVSNGYTTVAHSWPVSKVSRMSPDLVRFRGAPMANFTRSKI